MKIRKTILLCLLFSMFMCRVLFAGQDTEVEISSLASLKPEQAPYALVIFTIAFSLSPAADHPAISKTISQLPVETKTALKKLLSQDDSDCQVTEALE